MNIDRRLLKQALALSKNRFEIYRGYVCGLHTGARSFCDVKLHLMFFYRYPNRILSLEQIHAEYLDTYSDDDALPRDIGLAAENLLKKLMDAFQTDPTSNWDSDVGLELRKHPLDMAVDQEIGWVNVEDLASLSKSLAGELIIPPVDDAQELNPAHNLLPKQLELPF